MPDGRDAQPGRIAKLRLFGPQAQLVGQPAIAVRVDPGQTTCETMMITLAEQWPVLRASLASSRLAVNHELASPSTKLQGDEELALIGLIGGG